MSNKLKSQLFVLAALVPIVGAPSLALGLDGKTVDYWSHITECVTWLLNDPAKHAKYCNPSHVTQDQIDHIGGTNYAQTYPAPAPSSTSSSSSSSSSPPPTSSSFPPTSSGLS